MRSFTFSAACYKNETLKRLFRIERKIKKLSDIGFAISAIHLKLNAEVGRNIPKVFAYPDIKEFLSPDLLLNIQIFDDEFVTKARYGFHERCDFSVVLERLNDELKRHFFSTRYSTLLRELADELDLRVAA